MIDYEAMSDYKINEAVAESVIASELDKQPGRAGGEPWISVLDRFNQYKFDPCNNPVDAWPIILEHGISLAPLFSNLPSVWRAEKMNYSANHDKPLRCAMIVYLMMEKDND